MHFTSSSLSLFIASALLTSTIHAQLLPSLASPTQAPAQTKRGPWKCDLAQDGSGIPQQPYCCDENAISRRFQDGRILGVTNCTAVPADQNVQCAHAADVWCCYELNTDDASQNAGDGWVCTSVAEWRPSS